jgi:hypothetical protein
MAIVVCTVYGVKSSGARWYKQLTNMLHEFGFTSCKAGPTYEQANGDTKGEYVFIYADDISRTSHQPQKVMAILSSKYILEDGSNLDDQFPTGKNIPEEKCGSSIEMDKVALLVPFFSSF